MPDPYNVSVSVPSSPTLTPQEKADLKESFEASVVETLEAKGIQNPDVNVEIVMPSGG